MRDYPKVRPHYAYVVVRDGEIKKVFKSETKALAYLGVQPWFRNTLDCIQKFDLNTGERVRGRQSLYGYDEQV